MMKIVIQFYLYFKSQCLLKVRNVLGNCTYQRKFQSFVQSYLTIILIILCYSTYEIEYLQNIKIEQSGILLKEILKCEFGVDDNLITIQKLFGFQKLKLGIANNFRSLFQGKLLFYVINYQFKLTYNIILKPDNIIEMQSLKSCNSNKCNYLEQIRNLLETIHFQ
ncbi:unnamed protein product [Paramecium octaurelia]|uniref:Uncharacterized protein n=1 Tax=Paramecium octaurelia TaxID=43137 RepID=A0A8S1UYS6_PAROT|nr:unnamed protein product [Paramecium octaurelia]